MSKKLTQQEVESYCLEHDYRVLSKYINSNTKIKLKNIKTGEIGEMRFSHFKQGHRFDTEQPNKLTQQEVEAYCLEQDYRVLSRYKGNYTKIKLQNIKTCEIGEMTFNSFKRGHRFNNPKATKKITHKEFILPFTNENYTVLIDEKNYENVNVHTKIGVTCPNNHKWAVTRGNFVYLNRRCPMCNQNTLGGMSTGERMVYQILQGNNVNFEREKSMYIDENRYSFDFYFEVEEFDNIDRFFIEYDGIQHYHGNYFGDVEQRQVGDEIKDKYARDNNIQMIRIPWLNNTIDKVLFVINNETGLNLKKVDVDLPTIKEITGYYLSHTLKETRDRFNIGNKTVTRYFNQIYGMSKTEYLKMIDTTK